MMMVVTSHIVENPECLPYVLLLVLVMNLSHDMIFGHYPKENRMFYKRLKYADCVRRCRLHTFILIICRNSGKSIVPVPSLSTTLIRS